MNKGLAAGLSQLRKSGKKAFAVLLDPDKINDLNALNRLLHLSIENKVDYFFVGGSLITDDSLHSLVTFIKENCRIPVILFPGSNLHISPAADGLLFLSLISGRNPELLIGQHVTAAPILKKSTLEILPTGYLLISNSLNTAVAYMSQTQPIPNTKPSIAACTAMAGEMLGLQHMYLDAGSGAPEPVSPKIILAVRRAVNTPLIVGGGIRSAETAQAALSAGADVVVVGNGIEKNPNLMIEVSNMIALQNAALNVHE